MVNARHLAAAGPALAVAVLVIVNAWSGLMPGVGFWDTGEFQTVLPIMGTAHPTGYPTYVLLGFVVNILLTPIGEPAFRITVLSLLAVATAAGATVVLVRLLTGSAVIGMATGLGLALTPVVWENATRADPHALHLAFVAILLVVLVAWERARRGMPGDAVDAPADEHATSDAVPREATARAAAAGEPASAAPRDRRAADRLLLLAAVVFGLAAGNHSLSLLLVPPIAVYVLAVDPGIRRRWRFAFACVGAAVVTVTLVYLELPIRGGLIPAPFVYGQPATWNGFWEIALAEQFRGSLGNPFADLDRKVSNLVTLASNQFGVLSPAIPAAVIVAARRAPRYMLLTGSATVITVLFNGAYANADILRYYMGPVLWAWTWLGMLGAEVAAFVAPYGGRLGTAPSRARLPGRSVERTSVLVAVMVAGLMLLPTVDALDARRARANRAHDVGAQRWLDETLPILPRDAVLVSWWSTSTPVWYAQHVLGLRQDILLIDDRTMLDRGLGRAPDVIRRYLAEGRPVYAIRLAGRDLDELTRQFLMTRVASDGNTAVWAVHGQLAASR